MKCGKPYCACVGQCFAEQSPLNDDLELTTMNTNNQTNEQRERAELIRWLRSIRSPYAGKAAVLLEADAPRPALKPLTEEEIKHIKPVCADFVSFRAGIRALEIRLGIKEQA